MATTCTSSASCTCTFARPSTATVGGYLDDLDVDKHARGTGAADARIAALAQPTGERGWSIVRWIAADDGHRARSKYDQHATRTSWITYDMAPAPAGGGERRPPVAVAVRDVDSNSERCLTGPRPASQRWPG